MRNKLWWAAFILRAVAVPAFLLCVSFFNSAAQNQIAQTPAQAPPAGNETEISTRTTDTAIKVRVNVVLVRVVVRDSKGNPVPGLKQQDFQLLDNGKPQSISSFNVETPETHAKLPATSEENKTDTLETHTNASPSPAPAATAGSPERFIALVFDDQHMKAQDALAVRAATEKLFTTLSPADRVAIYSTSGEVQQDFTGDAETLRKALHSVVPRPARGEGGLECPHIDYYMADMITNKNDPEALSTAVAEAATNCPLSANDIRAAARQVLQIGDQNTQQSYQYLENMVRRMASMPGQRVVVFVSPGFILGDQVQADNSQVVERAIRAGVVVNTIDARGLYTADALPPIDAAPSQSLDKTQVDWQRIEGTYREQALFETGQVLSGIAASTGGTYFHNRNDLDAGMNQAVAAPAVSYVLGFSPQNMKLDGKLHKLKVALATPQKYQLQARNAYYAPKALADPEEAAKQEVRDVLFSRDEIVDVPVDLKTQFFKTDAASAQLTVFTHLDIKGIHFRKADGRSYNDVVLATAVFDNNGQFVDGQMREIALKLKDSTVDRLSQTGFTIKIAFTVKPGTYIVRSVVRGSEGDQMTARNATASIPD
jgi:VWFA-related protein